MARGDVGLVLRMNVRRIQGVILGAFLDLLLSLTVVAAPRSYSSCAFEIEDGDESC